MQTPWFWIFASAGLGCASSIWFREAIFLWLFVPSDGRLSPHDGLPIYTEVTGALSATIKLGLKAALFSALPPIWVVIMKRLKPWTPDYWWWFTIVVTLSSAALAVAGIGFVYYYFMPAGLGFLLGFSQAFAVPMIALGSYTGLMSSMMLWVSLFFQLPLIMFTLAKIGFMPYFRWRLLRKLWWSTMLILAGALSPGFDPVTALMLYVPMVALYEVGLLVAWLTNNRGEDFYYMRSITLLVWWIISRPYWIVHRIHRWLAKYGLVPFS